MSSAESAAWFVAGTVPSMGVFHVVVSGAVDVSVGSGVIGTGAVRLYDARGFDGATVMACIMVGHGEGTPAARYAVSVGAML